jgi:galactokinase
MIHNRTILEFFERSFGCRATLVARAPGRVNLIGEHTDYNGGFVMPMAIDREMKMAAAPNGEGLFRLRSLQFEKSAEFKTNQTVLNVKPGAWQTYFFAVVREFLEKGIELPGMDVVIAGDVPLGAGLSSSAAYEVCAATLLNSACDAGLSGKEIALLAQRAENSPHVGVQCGLMDQYASALGREDCAVMLDCFDREHEYVPIPSDDCAVIVINSNKRRELAGSEYNARRLECESALEKLRAASRENFPSLRHLPAEMLDRHARELTEAEFRRARHNVTENARVSLFSKALRQRDLSTAGGLLYGSHASLRDDFQVSCAELDSIVDIARRSAGVYGCRMTGGGFGGCAVALVKPASSEEFIQSMRDSYFERTTLVPEVYQVTATAGAEVCAAECV